MALSWSSASGRGNNQGKAGINISTSTSPTAVTITATFYVRTRYQCSDNNNVHYFGWGTSAGTRIGSVTVKHRSRTSWSSSNMTAIASRSITIARGTSAKTQYVSYRYTNIEWAGSSNSIRVAVTIPALASYTVSYNANGGTGAPSAQTKWYGKSLTLSSTAPTRSGYTFMGWGTSASAKTASYKQGASYTGNAALTLYAIWKKSLTLTYNANGGTGDIVSQSVDIYNAETSGNLTVTSAVPTRSGWTFVGWNTSASATTSKYSGGASITITGNTTLYAIWKKTLTLSYDANTGTGAPSAQSVTIYNATASADIAISETIPTKEGYAFMGWDKSPTAIVGAYTSGNITISENTTIYAIWKPMSLWHESVMWVNASGTWRRCEAYVNDNGTWKKCSLDVKCNTELEFK